MSRFSEALAHTKQLIQLGCDQEEALANTQVAFDLDDLTVDMLDSVLSTEEAWV